MKIKHLKKNFLNLFKKELKDEKNIEQLNDIFKPIVHNIIYQIYPYFILFTIIIVSILLFLIIILFINIKYTIYK
jgi:hypothetical protein